MEDKELIELTKEFFAENGADPKSLKQAEKEQPVVKEDLTTDLYQQNADKRFDESKKSRPKGASAVVTLATHDVIDESLAHAYKKAKDDSDLLKRQGERDRAEMRRQQYMEEYFLPAVEIVVNSSSPDEVLNSKKALDELDKYALLAGSGNGYTASYIRTAYGNQLGQKSGISDPYVTSQVRKLNSLLDSGEVRIAVGLAKGLRDKIDAGERSANEEDYELLSNVISYYE